MTGTAKSYSFSLQKCLDQLFQTTVMTLDDNSLELMKNTASYGEKSVVFIITSTTGDGQPPNHALGFKSTLDEALKYDSSCLNGLNYAVFALGSSHYENFCAFGIFCDETIKVLGGQRVTPVTLGDEQKGQDRAFKKWTEMSVTRASKMLELFVPKEVHQNWPFTESHLRKASWVPAYSLKTANNQNQADLLTDLKMLHGSSLQNVNLLDTVLVAQKMLSERYYMFTLGFPNNPNLSFQPGDHFFIFPENDPLLVKQIIDRLVEIPEVNEVVVWEGKRS